MTSTQPSAAEASGGPRTHAALVLLAAGSGSRVGHRVNKALMSVAGRPVFAWSLHWARDVPAIGRTVLVISQRDRGTAQGLLASHFPDADVDIVVGGATRHESEWNALRVLEAEIESGELDVVVIHDAARPLARTRAFADVVAAARRYGGAVPVRPQAGLVTTIADDAAPVGGVAVQTPQAFRGAPLLDAYRQAAASTFLGTDTASCVERFTDLTIRCVLGDAENVKITFPEDVELAGRLLELPAAPDVPRGES